MIPGTIVGTVGDVNPISYGGGFVIRGEDGSYDLEYCIAPEEDHDDPEARWYVYRTDLSAPGDWCKWKDVASCCGMLLSDYVEPFAAPFLEGELFREEQDKNAARRAEAILDAARYYGWENFDSYPLLLTKDEIEARYAE